MYRTALVVFCVILASCNDGLLQEAEVAKDNLSEEKVWVWAHFNVPSESQAIDSYYYYGKVSGKLFEKIRSHEVQSGLIFLDKVRYYSSSDESILAYSDDLDDDLLAFRIEHIARLIKLKKTPAIGFSYNDEDSEEVPLSNSSETQVENE